MSGTTQCDEGTYSGNHRQLELLPKTLHKPCHTTQQYLAPVRPREVLVGCGVAAVVVPCRPGPPAALVPTILGQVYQVINAEAVSERHCLAVWYLLQLLL